MTKRVTTLSVLLIAAGLSAGCATGRNYQTDIDMLNARVSTLQAQLSEKDQEISRLQGQLDGQQSALSQAESEKRMLADKLDAALARQEAEARKAAAAPAPKDDSSYLK